MTVTTETAGRAAAAYHGEVWQAMHTGERMQEIRRFRELCCSLTRSPHPLTL